LINRRHYLPRLLLTLSSKYDDKNNPSDLQMLTGSHHINFRVDGHTPRTRLCTVSLNDGARPNQR
jgi:hypothetical protein